MNCLEASNKLDDYFDRVLTPSERAAVDVHAAACINCGEAMARERDLREMLRRLPVPEPDMALFQRAMASAVEADYLHRRRRWLASGGAIAAGIVLMIGLNVEAPMRDTVSPEPPAVAVAPVQAPEGRPEAMHVGQSTALPGVTLALNEEREISLSLESLRDLDDATFTVVLPEGIELSGYPGLREITWTGRLASGRNLLVLPLRAQAGTGGEVTAHIAHIERRASVTLRMEVVPPVPAIEPPPIEPITVM